VDHDGDIVSPQRMASAVKEWLGTYPAVRYQHRGDHPAGRGLEAWQDADGATWLRALVVDDAAVKMVKKHVLTAFSVGLTDVQTQKSARAPRFEIVGFRLAEVSLVDSPSNARCGITVCAKSRGGSLEYVGKAFGSVVKVKVPKVGKAFRRELVAWDLNSSVPAIREAAYRSAAGSPSVTKAAKGPPVAEKAFRARLRAALDSADPQAREMARRELMRYGLLG
jgi:hypothetical protein